MTEPWTVEFYEEPGGYRPVDMFIRSLRTNPKLRAKVFRSMELLEEFGTGLPMPHSRPMTGYDFRELRVQLASDIARVFYVAAPDRRMVLLHGFVKKTQRTPRAELEIAQQRLEELRRGRERSR